MKTWLPLLLLTVSTSTYAADDFRIQKLERAMQSHDKVKPPGWDNLVSRVKAISGDVARLQFVHALFNQIPYLDGTNGQYMTPMEAIKRGGVVCKDYAMGKYLLLKEAGVDPKKMAVVVHDSIGDSGGAHVVLEMTDQGQTYVSNQWLRKAQEQFQKTIGVNKVTLMKEVKQHGFNTLLQHVETADTIDPVVPLKYYPYKSKKTFQKFNQYGNIT